MQTSAASVPTRVVARDNFGAMAPQPLAPALDVWSCCAGMF